MRNIGLIGKARSGKDTVARRLCEAHGYQRVAFADPLKVMALSVDPIVSTKYDGTQFDRNRLSSIVARIGWESAKEFPEVRRILQQMGQTVRALDPDFWVRIALDNIFFAPHGQPVVVSDVRYPNEAEALRAAGFTLVRIVRSATHLFDSEAAHESETALDGFATDATIANIGSMDDLHRAVDALAQP